MLVETTDLHAQFDEATFIKRALEGDKVAFKALYDRHLPMVYGLALRLVNDVSAAEEVTQESFVKLWQSLRNFKGESQLSTWLHRLTSNTAVDYLRKQRSWLQVVREKFVEEEPTQAPQHDDARDLNKLIQRLPERARIVFVLSAVEGYQHDEIAKITGMAVGSSKAQLNRARRLLKEWLAYEH